MSARSTLLLTREPIGVLQLTAAWAASHPALELGVLWDGAAIAARPGDGTRLVVLRSRSVTTTADLERLAPGCPPPFADADTWLTEVHARWPAERADRTDHRHDRDLALELLARLAATLDARLVDPRPRVDAPFTKGES